MDRTSRTWSGPLATDCDIPRAEMTHSSESAANRRNVIRAMGSRDSTNSLDPECYGLVRLLHNLEVDNVTSRDRVPDRRRWSPQPEHSHPHYLCESSRCTPESRTFAQIVRM